MTEKPLVQTQVASVGADDPGRNERLSGRKSKKPGDSRLESQRDVDRITYSREWRRLGAVTQVVTPSIEENPLLHTRLTHSEKVAQVARSIAAHLFEVEDHSLIARLGGIDLHVCEAAALAHDLGHPPFGHVGELTLDRIARKDLKLMDGFEGNAQSIRIVTIGSLRSLSYEGLDLTKATLAAIAKYPWIRARTLADEQHEKSLKDDPKYRREWKKFNFYDSQATILEQVRGFVNGKIDDNTQTLEASVMDVADDISYAVHDLEDFILAGIVNLPRVRADLEEFKKHLVNGSNTTDSNTFLYASERLAIDYNGYYDRDLAIEAAREILKHFDEGFIDSSTEPAVREVASRLVERYINGIRCSEQTLWEHGPHLGLDKQEWHEVQLLKEITKHYVIARPDFALHQRGQQTILVSLVSLLREWASDKDDAKRLPLFLRNELEIARSQAADQGRNTGFGRNQHGPRGPEDRAIIDYLCTLGDAQCRALYQKLSGAHMHVVHGFSGF